MKKNSKICSLQRKTSLAPSAYPLTEDYRPSDRKLYTVNRHLVGRSRKQHPVTLATRRKRLQIILLIPTVRDFFSQDFTLWFYTNIKPWSSASINHTDSFQEFAHRVGETQTTPELQLPREAKENCRCLDLLKSNTAVSLRYLIHFRFPHKL